MKTRHSREYQEDLKRFPSRKGRNFHHFQYDHLRDRPSTYWIDGMYLPRWVHVPIIHRILGGSERARNQPFGRFPNIAQRLVHWICRILFVIF
jgi:hypothetical protein